MRLFPDTPVRRLAITPVLVLGLSAFLAGCNSQTVGDANQSMADSLRSWVGTGSPDPDDIPPEEYGSQRPDAFDTVCPPVIVRDGTETYRVYEKGHEDDPAYVVYQGGIVKTARECEYIEASNAVRIKLGIAGKVVTGPSWNNGPVSLPIRAAFVRTATVANAAAQTGTGAQPKPGDKQTEGGSEAVWTQLYDVQPAIVPGDTVQQFTQVDDSLYYEFPPGETIGRYVIYVGFDEMGSRR